MSRSYRAHLDCIHEEPDPYEPDPYEPVCCEQPDTLERLNEILQEIYYTELEFLTIGLL